MSVGCARYYSTMDELSQVEGSWTLDAAERWLSRPRLQRYLDPSGQELELALRLYRWNTATSTAAMVELAHLEVAMRNAYVHRLSAKHPDWLSPSSKLWSRRIGNSARQVDQQKANETTLDRLEEAENGLRHNKTPDRIVANTSLGLWCNLTDQHREPTIWTPMLSSAYPPGTKRGPVHRMALNVNTFRNRVAHHEPLFSNTTALGERVREVRILHALIDPFSADHVFSDQLQRLVTACPVPRLVKWPDSLNRRPSSLLMA